MEKRKFAYIELSTFYETGKLDSNVKGENHINDFILAGNGNYIQTHTFFLQVYLNKCINSQWNLFLGLNETNITDSNPHCDGFWGNKYFDFRKFS